MTCIAGVVDHGKVYIGGDSAGLSGWSLTVRADEKVFLNGELIFGFTSSFRMGQLLRYRFNPPVPAEDEDIDHYMVSTFIDAVRECLKNGGWALKDKEQESGGNFLVGFRGQLYEVCADYQVGKMADGYAAVGCGSDIAVGSLFSTTKDSPEKRLRIALLAAEHHSGGVRGPFVVLNK